LIRRTTGEPVTGPVNPYLLHSPLFGAVRQVPGAAPGEEEIGTDLRPRVRPPDPAGHPPRTSDDVPKPTGELVTASRAPLNRPLATPLDRLLGRGDAVPAAQPQAGGIPGPARPGAAGTSDDRPGAGGTAPSLLARLSDAGDIFTGMRRAKAQLLQPIGGTAGPLAEAGRVPGAPATGLLRPLTDGTAEPRDADAEAAPPAAAAAARGPVATEPLRTFVGTEASRLNRYLADAEELLKSGQYYSAADQYDLARAVAPRNPLPLLGQSMSLLGAGDYMSSAASLFRAIRMYESLAEFTIDMTAFMPDIEVLDRRRADLENLLAGFEDYRLRFLLGYAEVSSGLGDVGLADLEKSARGAPAGMESLGRFVEALRRRTVGPDAPIDTPAPR
jgi:hypothetical protein